MFFSRKKKRCHSQTEFVCSSSCCFHLGGGGRFIWWEPSWSPTVQVSVRCVRTCPGCSSAMLQLLRNKPPVCQRSEQLIVNPVGTVLVVYTPWALVIEWLRFKPSSFSYNSSSSRGSREGKWTIWTSFFPLRMTPWLGAPCINMPTFMGVFSSWRNLAWDAD